MRISTIIPASNAELCLARAVESLLATGYGDLEIVVVDDGSSDGTWAVAEELVARHPGKVRLLCHPGHVNRGVSATRNLGIRESTGELICFLDADDYVFPYRFERAIAMLEDDPLIDGIYELTQMIYEGERAQSSWSETGAGDLFGITTALEPKALLATLLRGFPWSTSAFICRRSLLERTGLFHEKLKIAEDCHLWFRMAVVGRIVAGDLTRPVSAYVRHDRNTFQHSVERKVDMVRAMADAWRWVQREASSEVKDVYQKGQNEFIINGLIVARESSRRDVAWRVVGTAIREGYYRFLVVPNIVRQLSWLCLDSFTGGNDICKNYARLKTTVYEKFIIPILHTRYSRMIDRMVVKGSVPRIAFVKQDVNEDLYCCPPFSSPQDIVASTILRSGPVALFSKFSADFYILKTEEDLECNIWKEKWTYCKWAPIEWFESFVVKIPGRDYGNCDHALEAEKVDWGNYDIVISCDISVPERIIEKFSSVVWCYFIREIKTPSYSLSLNKAVPGYHLFLSQKFDIKRSQASRNIHVVDFPYHLHHYGCFHQLYNKYEQDSARKGIFLEHHGVANLTVEQLRRLERFGKVSSTALMDTSSYEQYQVTSVMQPDVLDKMLSSKYFVKCGGRPVFGTAMVEAIAAGCLVVGDPAMLTHNFVYSKNTTAVTFDDIVRVLEKFELDHDLYSKELKRQRALVDYTCFSRPIIDLFRKAKLISRKKFIANEKN